MLFKSEVLTQASGSVGGVTYSHNSAGMYRRARAIPVNPNTMPQTMVRAAFTELVVDWPSLLTPTQRETWNEYGAVVPVTNALGDPIFLSGQNWYIAANTPRLQAQAVLADPLTFFKVITNGTIFDRGTFSTPTFTASQATGLSIAFTPADEWATEDGAFMFIYQSQPRSATRNFFAGPYRFVGAIVGAGVPPVSPFVITPAQLAARGFSIVAGQAINLVASVSRVDGRISTRRNMFPPGGVDLPGPPIVGP